MERPTSLDHVLVPLSFCTSTSASGRRRSFFRLAALLLPFRLPTADDHCPLAVGRRYAFRLTPRADRVRPRVCLTPPCGCSTGSSRTTHGRPLPSSASAPCPVDVDCSRATSPTVARQRRRRSHLTGAAQLAGASLATAATARPNAPSSPAPGPAHPCTTCPRDVCAAQVLPGLMSTRRSPPGPLGECSGR